MFLFVAALHPQRDPKYIFWISFLFNKIESIKINQLHKNTKYYSYTYAQSIGITPGCDYLLCWGKVVWTFTTCKWIKSQINMRKFYAANKVTNLWIINYSTILINIEISSWLSSTKNSWDDNHHYNESFVNTYKPYITWNKLTKSAFWMNFLSFYHQYLNK